ncbi:membrane bound O-acyl transferase family-domain-containing protein [Paraphoma chrysanthemicola]|uniref:Membrane bound O-acyl transferase family-domain-containing protein n=1 Tax=Paraphoma chrysanthemicola TaxID=798071 RepID=A0A8K0W548_9PLEO|nr:membrane bound O-acyl transferase family-domain-containing protein [Paraphoma chrysanthemicola]
MHPIVYLIAEVVLTVLIIGFTQPHSHLRPVGLLLVMLCVTRCIPGCMPYMVRTPWAALVGGYSVTYLYHYMDIALLSRWSFASDAPISGLLRPTTDTASAQENSTSSSPPSMWARLKFGIKLTTSFRFVGTRYEARNTPRAATKSSREFRRRTFITIVLSYVVLDFINAQNDPAIASRFLTLKNIPLLARLHEVTLEESVIRIFTVIAAAVGLTCVQGGIYHVFALLAVSLGISEPADWPPFYGSISEAYMLRRFWDICWHQTNTRKFSSIAHYTTHVVFRLPRGTALARYTRLLIAFMSSGIMHLVIDLASGVTLHDSGAMRFFMLQAVGLIFEDCIVRLYDRVPVSMQLPKTLAKALGFICVSIFLVWSVPAYMYPMMWRGNQGMQDSTIPYSFFGPEAERGKALSLLSIFSAFAFLA